MDTRSEIRDYRPGVVALAVEIVSAMRIGFHIPVTTIARWFGISRQSVYDLRTEVRQALDAAFERRTPGPAPRPSEAGRDLVELRRQHSLARLRIEVLTYERDQELVLAQSRREHLGAEHRSFLVGLFRRWREAGLSENAIAEAIGVPLTSLRRWNEEADADGRFPRKPDGRGEHRKPGVALVREVVTAYEALEEQIPLCEFVKTFNQDRAEPVPADTISKILRAHGLRRARHREKHKLPPERFRVYFPGAQFSLDGKEIVIGVGGNEVRVTCQAGIDIATSLILGHVIGLQETAEGTRVTIRAAREVAPYLAALLDNKAPNVAGADACAGMEVGPIFSFYYRPQSNGHLEGGLWGQLVKTVGPIEIDTSSPEAIAKSVAHIIMKVYTHFWNHMPRERLGGKSPLEYFRTYAPTTEQVERARRELQETKRRSERAHRRAPEISAEKRILIETVCAHWGFDAQEQLPWLAPFDRDLISEADSIFAALTQRQDWSQDKRNPRYFYAIVRNLQKRRDDDRQNAHAVSREAELLKRRIAEKQREIEEEERVEQERLRTRPDDVLREYLEMAARTQFRFFPAPLWSRLKTALEPLRKMGAAGCERFTEILAWLELLPAEAAARARFVARLREAFDGA